MAGRRLRSGRRQRAGARSGSMGSVEADDAGFSGAQPARAGWRLENWLFDPPLR